MESKDRAKHLIAAFIGTPVAQSKGAEDAEDGGPEGCDECLGEAFDALKGDDKEGFVVAIKNAIEVSQADKE